MKPGKAVSPEQTLRRLFLMLFLRGRAGRGLGARRAAKTKKVSTGPMSIAKRLWIILGIDAFFGMMAMVLVGQPVFPLAIYMHGMTFIFVSMFVASSAGEVLFNKEEADILMHRPIAPRTMLWAKIAVLVQVSLWLAGALNLATFFIGVNAPNGGWGFIPAHMVSVALEALFCTGFVVLTYQLCLRWLGRERLDGLMTTVQIVFSVALVLGGQIVPRVMSTAQGTLKTALDQWWTKLLPPAWFAGIDDALAGSGSPDSLILAGAAVAVTATVVWLAFGRLADDYNSGLQVIGEVTRTQVRAGRRTIDRLVHAAPLKWFLGDSVTRASFLLVASYLMRDRDVKLRIYPALAPMLVVPIVIMLPMHGGGASRIGDFGIAFAGNYLCLLPLTAVNLLEYSQQWQAADLFRIAPTAGPAALSAGARRAMMLLLAIPMMVAMAGLTLLLGTDTSHLALLLPGVLAMPIYALIPCLGGRGVPFAQSPDAIEASKRPMQNLAYMLLSFALAGLAYWAWHTGWFQWMLLGEAVLGGAVFYELSSQVREARWPSIE